MANRFLITGGAGFIGSWLIELIMDAMQDATVVNLDALTYAGHLDNLTAVRSNPRYRFVHGDISDRALVLELMQNADICINVAAQTHVDRSISGPELFVETNITGTSVLLDAARKAGIQRFIQVSTDEVYGSIAGMASFSETDKLNPSSPYSASKASGDLLALSYYKTYGLPVCITRCSNNYGPRQFPEKLIPLFIMNACHNKRLPVYGDGKNKRDWIYVTDHCKAILAVLQHGQPGEIYNIGTGDELDNLSITKTLLSLLDKPEHLIEFVADRPAHDWRYALNTTKIKTTLNWSPEVSFETGLQKTIEWYQHRSSTLAV
ncbi:MAG: dTDP-glucose 4,6-dehydratase [Cyanobacteria bacterium P01_H01_bin.74]